MSDLSTSLKEIFNERISSPFYGSLIVSWLLWNWKIPYVTFFVDQSRLGDSLNKIEYIRELCSNPWHLILFPLLSTALILFILPYATNYAYYKTAQFDRWRKDKQIEIDRSQVLTVEQSLKILSDAQKQEESFKNLLTSRDEQIKLLTQQLDTALKDKKLKDYTPKNKNGKNNNEDYSDDLKAFLINEQVLKDYETITNYIQQRKYLDSLNSSSVQYCIAYGLIEHLDAGGYYKLTEKGKFFLRELIKKKSNVRIKLQSNEEKQTSI